MTGSEEVLNADCADFFLLIGVDPHSRLSGCVSPIWVASSRAWIWLNEEVQDD